MKVSVDRLWGKSFEHLLLQGLQPQRTFQYWDNMKTINSAWTAKALRHSHYWLLNLDDSSSERDFDGRSKYVTQHFAPSRFLAMDSSFAHHSSSSHQSKVIMIIAEPLLKLRAHYKIVSTEVFALGATLWTKKLIMKMAWKPLTRVGHKRTYLTALSVSLHPSMMHRRNQSKFAHRSWHSSFLPTVFVLFSKTSLSLSERVHYFGKTGKLVM